MGKESSVPNNGQPQPDSTTGLGNVLFPVTRQKVLALLFGNPQREYSISELIERAGAGYGAVQREVERMVAGGLVTTGLSGRQKRYRANPDSPIYSELCSLVRKTMSPAERLRTALGPAGESIELAILYGSVARGSDRADSDIDVLLVSDTLSLEEVFRVFVETEQELGRAINPTLYTPAEFRQRLQQENSFLRRMLAGKHIVLKGDPDGPNLAG